MSTVTPPRTTRNLEQDRSRIKSPLARLRKYIHSYVSLEGAALVGLFLALWFWIGMLLDYGFFKVFLVDWVQELPWGVRLGMLLAAAAAVVALFAYTVLTRLFTDFTDAAVAIVLERRFPKQLGDRLITAVELSDPTAAAAHGYSADMVRETIHEAADRVDQIPVKEVFDWKRLIARAVLVGVLTLVLYVVVGTGFAAVRALRGESPALAGYSDLNEATGIWVERNVLLRNTIWPRRSYLEIIDFPENLRIPRESTPPSLRVRAWKYVVADPNHNEGWGLLTWAHLKERPDLVADAPELPADWSPRSDELGMTVDEVELKLDAFPVRTSLPGKELPARWCVASDQDDSGWRPLMWKDLTKEKLGGLNVPDLPGDWDPKALPALIASGAGLIGGPMAAASRILVGPKYISLSVDEVQQQLEKAQKEQKPGLAGVQMVFERLERLASIREALDKLDAKAAERSMGRTVRKLIVPASVSLVYKSNRATNTNTMTRVADNEYTGNFNELKETVSFWVQGEDYVTRRRLITVVDRPRLERLESEEERPAYLYYRPAKDGSPLDIRAQRQLFAAVSLSVSGDATTIEVPSGTTLTLTGTVTKPLTNAEVVVEKKDEKNYTGEKKPEMLEDGRRFRMRLADVRREQRFTFRFTDDDEVTADRKVVIAPKEDTSPRVREFNPDEVIRRGKEGYLVAVGCRIPFKGKARDDQGLARVRYACRVIPGDFLSEQKMRALDGVAAIPMLAPGFGTQLLGLAYMTGVTREMSKASTAEASAEQFIELPAFAQALESHQPGEPGNRSVEFLERGAILSRLKEKKTSPYRRLLNEFTIAPDNWTSNDEDPSKPSRWVRAQDQRSPLVCDLPLWKLTHNDKPLRDPDSTKPQKRYLIEVRLVVEDTYLEGEIDPKTNLPIPHVSASGETFTFVVVPENELLSRIAEEEDTRYRELQKAFKPLPENLNHMRDTDFALSAGGLQAAELNAFIARCDALSETLKTSQQDTKAVMQAYERIVRELRTNQLSETVLNKVFTTIYTPLVRVADVQFDVTNSAVLELRKALDAPEASVAARIEAARPKAGAARKQLNELVTQMNAILSAMEGLAKINELIKQLQEIEKQEEDLESLAIKLHKRAIERALQEP